MYINVLTYINSKNVSQTLNTQKYIIKTYLEDCNKSAGFVFFKDVLAVLDFLTTASDSRHEKVVLVYFYDCHANSQQVHIVFIY